MIRDSILWTLSGQMANFCCPTYDRIANDRLWYRFIKQIPSTKTPTKIFYFLKYLGRQWTVLVSTAWVWIESDLGWPTSHGAPPLGGGQHRIHEFPMTLRARSVVQPCRPQQKQVVGRGPVSGEAPKRLQEQATVRRYTDCLFCICKSALNFLFCRVRREEGQNSTHLVGHGTTSNSQLINVSSGLCRGFHRFYSIIKTELSQRCSVIYSHFTCSQSSTPNRPQSKTTQTARNW